MKNFSKSYLMILLGVKFFLGFSKVNPTITSWIINSTGQKNMDKFQLMFNKK